jgi:hypothetical protein
MEYSPAGVQGREPRADPTAALDSLEEAVYRAVVYADIFDFPLTRDEVFVYITVPAPSRAAVERAIDHALAQGSASLAAGAALARAFGRNSRYQGVSDQRRADTLVP